MFQTLSDLRRLLRAARVLARYDALIPSEYDAQLPASLKAARFFFGGRKADRESPPGVRLAHALESLGPAYIKLGQVLATRPDVIGAEIATALESLQDRLPPFPTEIARDEIARAFNRSPDALFVVLGEPMAAASIAQVHPAETSDEPPRRVAVKVLRPGIEAEFARDLSAFALGRASDRTVLVRRP